jgi:hypothetical protein
VTVPFTGKETVPESGQLNNPVIIKTRLSYRDRSWLGRPLHPEQAREVSHIALRLAALLLLEPTLDANYAAVLASISTEGVLAPEIIPI